MKNILIYIDTSLGELDWLLPFIKSKQGKIFNFYILLNEFGLKINASKVKAISKSYNLDEKNIYLVNRFTLTAKIASVLIFFLKIFLFIPSFSKKIYEFEGVIKVLLLKYRSISFDYIFRDAGLDDSLYLNYFVGRNQSSKIIVFPNGVGLMPRIPGAKQDTFRLVPVDLWLENSEFSDMAKNVKEYAEVFYVSGSPPLDINYRKKSLYDYKSKRAIVITRNCRMDYGFDYEMAFDALHKILDKLNKGGFSVDIKHHPRQRNLSKWRRIQSKFPNINELTDSLNGISKNYSVCLTLHSSAPIFLLSRGIPVLEFSPYKKFKEYSVDFTYHFENKDGYLTNLMIDKGLYEKIESEYLEDYLQKEKLDYLSRKQLEVCKQMFPTDANSKITHKLVEMMDDKN